MRISIKATNIELTDPLRLYVTERVESVRKLTTVSDESLHAAVEIGKTTHHHRQGNVFRAEVNFHLAHTLIRAVAVKDDLYAAIDEMKEELARELSSYKDKDRTLMRRGAARVKAMMKGFGDMFRKKTK
jgi:ribosomal subunit interface protein